MPLPYSFGPLPIKHRALLEDCVGEACNGALSYWEEVHHKREQPGHIAGAMACARVALPLERQRDDTLTVITLGCLAATDGATRTERRQNVAAFNLALLLVEAEDSLPESDVDPEAPGAIIDEVISEGMDAAEAQLMVALAYKLQS